MDIFTAAKGGGDHFGPETSFFPKVSIGSFDAELNTYIYPGYYIFLKHHQPCHSTTALITP